MLYEGVSARPTTIPLAEVRESVSGQPMSAAGQTRHFDCAPTTSGLPQRTDILRLRRHVSKVPKAEAMPAREYQRRRKTAIVRSIKKWLC